MICGTFSLDEMKVGKEVYMYKILKKEVLNPTVTKLVVEAPFVAKHAKAGQFFDHLPDRWRYDDASEHERRRRLYP